MPDDGQEPKTGTPPLEGDKGAGTTGADGDKSQDGEPKSYDESYVKGLRAENAAARVARKEAEERVKAAEDRLKALEDAQKSESERLAEKAAKADTLAAELEALKAEAGAATAALAAEVEAQKATLPKEMLDLMPTIAPAAQLDWIRKAREAAEKLKPTTGPNLPPAGNRNPSHTNTQNGPTDEERRLAARVTARRF